MNTVNPKTNSSYFIILISIVLLADSGALAEDKEFIWLEAEDYTTATQGIQIIKAAGENLPEQGKENGKWFLKRSGWDIDSGSDVSGGAYLEMKAGARMKPDFIEKVMYEFNIAKEGNYYIWLRCNAPPPCWQFIDLWLDAPDSKEKKLGYIFFGNWNMWNWWRWDQEFFQEKPMSFHLTAGSHRLFFGKMSFGFKIDKLLITNDLEYMPFGAERFYFNGTFETPQIVHPHDQTKIIYQIEPKATGWESFPAARWKIKEEQSSNNHYYFVEEGDQTQILSYALIQNQQYRFFNARFSVPLSGKLFKNGTDALFIFSFKNDKNYWALQFDPDKIVLLQYHEGRTTTIKSCPLALAEMGKWTPFSVEYTRAGLIVRTGAKEVLAVRLPILAQGAIGVGSFRGCIGFDDIEVRPLDNSKAGFDFSGQSDPALQDWRLIRGGQESSWNPKESLRRGDVLLYKSPLWSGAQVTLDLESRAMRTGSFSILYPFANPRQFMELRLGADSNGKAQLISHANGHEKQLAAAMADLGSGRAHAVGIQSTKGLLTVFMDGSRVFEANEYELLEGTVGFLFHDNFKRIPVRGLKIEKKDILIDNFPLAPGGSIDPHWHVRDGSWRVASVFESELDKGDGQLTARGKGSVLIGEKRWCRTLFQISTQCSENSEFALLAGVEGDGAYELYCQGKKLQLRKVVAGIPLILAESTESELGPGWHRFGLAAGGGELKAELDGRPCLQVKAAAVKDCAGLRNYADFAVFDNLTIHVLASEEEHQPGVKKVDSLFVDIEESLVK